MPTDRCALRPTILARPALCEPGELLAAANAFEVATSRVGLTERLVIGRLSVMPHYGELVADLAQLGSRLINPLSAHQALADFAWYAPLAGLTPETWFTLAEVRHLGVPMVVKAAMGSRKLKWSEQMFAATYADAVRITGLLQDDSLLGEQPIVYRRFVPLRTLEVGLFALPFANEWRCFAYRGQVLATGAYWLGMTDRTGTFAPEGLAVAQEAARRLADVIPFSAIDVAETAEGGWIVVEVNDGQMAGLQGVSADTLYRRLAEAMAATPDSLEAD